ncbi:hypothetical protein BpHYR1_023414 [Brachionus plicatilis]|uniref:Uncharacterized protein n=1 Tax=Brachionus plicatilis TaxID=10195 RepID=A0A3M7QZ34_BRAPC|nr:hypothetical protein BpHYR1_023414 [Brachionus plicatilis]
MGALKKYSENLTESKVADVTINLRSFRFCTAFFIKPNSTSVCIVLSCASSSITTEYCFMSESMRHSLSNMPSVMCNPQNELCSRPLGPSGRPPPQQHASPPTWRPPFSAACNLFSPANCSLPRPNTE